MAKHRSGNLTSLNEAACRVIWNSTYHKQDPRRHGRVNHSPWVFFKNQTAMRNWEKDMRKLCPGIKFEESLWLWSPDQLESSIAEHGRKKDWER